MTKQVLHRDEVGRAVLTKLIDLNDVRVVEVDADPGFVDEHADQTGVILKLGNSFSCCNALLQDT